MNRKAKETMALKMIWRTLAYSGSECTIKSYCGPKTSILEVPESIGKRKVISIFAKALSAYSAGYRRPMKGLKEIKLPQSVLFIGAEAFSYSEALHIELPSCLHVLGERAFQHCQNLAAISLPPGLKRLESSCFEGCSSLETVNLPYGLEEIGQNAFKNCLALRSLYIPESVRHITENDTESAFSDCPELSVYAPSGSYAEQYAEHHGLPFVAIPPMSVDTPTPSPQTGAAPALSFSEELTKILAQPYQLSQKDKVLLLEQAILEGSIEDVARVIETLRCFEFTARALGLAVRYGGPEKTRMLCKAGASFDYDAQDNELRRLYHTHAELFSKADLIDYRLFAIVNSIMGKYGLLGIIYADNENLPLLCPARNKYDDSWYISRHEERPPLSEEERVESLDMALQHEGANLDTLMTYAILFKAPKMIELLRRYGAKVSINNIPDALINAYDRSYDWQLFAKELRASGIDALGNGLYKRLLQRRYWKADNYTLLLALVLATQNLQSIDKRSLARLLFYAIRAKNSKAIKALSEHGIDTDVLSSLPGSEQKAAVFTEIHRDTKHRLEYLDRYGLIRSHYIDTYIEEAQDGHCYTALAYLIDWKSQHVDTAELQRKREQRILLMLNEDPQSASALRKLWTVRDLPDRQLAVSGYKGSEEYLVVPERVGTKTVSAVHQNAFDAVGWGEKAQRYSALRHVILPDSVVSIGARAFSSCRALVTVHFPNGLRTLGDKAFSYCTSLKQAILPDTLTSIGSYAFEECQQLKQLVLSANLVEIGRDAFLCCSALQSVTIPGSLVRLTDRCFRNCTSLREITLSPQLRLVDLGAFWGSKSLEKLIVKGKDTLLQLQVALYFITESEHFTIYGPKASWAEQFAISEGIPFETIAEES